MAKIIKFEDLQNEGFNNISAVVYRAESGGYGHIYIDFLYLDTESDELKYFGNYESDNLYLLSGLTITCQYNTDKSTAIDKSSIRIPYAFEVSYKEYTDSVSTKHLEKLEGRLKLLKKIQNKYYKFCQTFGTPQYGDFGAYVQIMLALMGIDNILKSDYYTKIYDVREYINNLISNK